MGPLLELVLEVTMPITPTYPGVYVEEIPSGVRPITGVATSVTAFLGPARWGPVNEATTITGWGDFERMFGGLWGGSPMSYAVRDFFDNGGSTAVIVRLWEAPPDDDDHPTAAAHVSIGDLVLEASSPGAWGQGLRAFVTVADADDDAPFDLYVLDEASGRRERHELLRAASDSPHSADRVLAASSGLIRVHTLGQPEASTVRELDRDEHGVPKEDDHGDPVYKDVAALPPGFDPFSGPRDAWGDKLKVGLIGFEDGSDGGALTQQSYYGSELGKTGLFALTTDEVDIFNLVCLPPPRWEAVGDAAADHPSTLWELAAEFCKSHRAFLIVDPPQSWDAPNVALTSVIAEMSDFGGPSDGHAALYFPRIQRPDAAGVARSFVPCGAVAGVMARTDAERGVWKAPAGLDAGLTNAPALTRVLSDFENGLLNPRAVNVIRPKPASGRVIWGARTLDGDDRETSEWKYVPVRRTALFIEESLYRGTQWAVFMPNAEPLWASLRINVEAFMQRLFKQGAFQGARPNLAYSVAVDSSTTTQADIDLGIVNIEVGFAPLKPAEFVFLKIRQLAGQTSA
jgi:phage tail sheath protein FI